MNVFYPRYLLLTAAMFSYSGKNQKAVDLLELAVEDDNVNIDLTNRLNMLLNLAVYYFQAEDYRLANQTLLKIQHTDKWCEKKMGMEWRFKKNLIEIIIQIELGNVEIALTRMKSIERYFSEFLEHSLYQRARIFLRLIRHVIEKPEAVKTPEFAKYVDDVVERLPGDKEDIQAMTFYCWLKSKMLGLNYYEVLVKTIEEFGGE